MKANYIEWNERMTEEETTKLFMNLFLGLTLSHVYLGQGRIMRYLYGTSVVDDMLEMSFIRIPGIICMTVEQLVSDKLCMRALGALRKKVDRICEPYIDYQYECRWEAKFGRLEETEELDTLVSPERMPPDVDPSTMSQQKATTRKTREQQTLGRIIRDRTPSDDDVGG